MAATFTYDSAEEDWDLNTLHVLNSQLEAYLKMVCDSSFSSWIFLSIVLLYNIIHACNKSQI